MRIEKKMCIYKSYLLINLNDMFLKEIKPKKNINKNELHKLNSQLQIEQKTASKTGLLSCPMNNETATFDEKVKLSQIIEYVIF